MGDAAGEREGAYISCSGLVKIHKVAELEVVALQGLELEVARGEVLALVGPSGAGKSTLLSLLGGLDRPSAGRLEVGGRDLLSLGHAELSEYRRERVGFVWQQTGRNLLPYLSARENVELLMALSGRPRRERGEWARELLDAVGMAEHAGRRPGELSGGQQQRAAIACALANGPELLLGDEPTGEVDWPTAELILSLLGELRERLGLTVVLVTHDARVAALTDRTVAIRDGRTSTETVRGAGQSRAADSPARPPEESVVLDSAGRLQLPEEQRALAGIGRRARVEVVEGGLLVRSLGEGRIDAEELAPVDGVESAYQGLYGAASMVEADAGSRPERRWRPWRRRARAE